MADIMSNDTLIAIPNKGRLRPTAMRFLKSCGIAPLGRQGERKMALDTNIPGIKLLCRRAADIPECMGAETAIGTIRFGITGLDWVKESGLPLAASLLNWYPSQSIPAMAIITRNDANKCLRGKVSVITQYPNIAMKFAAENNLEFDIKTKQGALESFLITRECDAINDIVQTGTTITDNNLKIVRPIMDVYPVLVASPELNILPEQLKNALKMLARNG